MGDGFGRNHVGAQRVTQSARPAVWSVASIVDRLHHHAVHFHRGGTKVPEPGWVLDAVGRSTWTPSVRWALERIAYQCLWEIGAAGAHLCGALLLEATSLCLVARGLGCAMGSLRTCHRSRWTRGMVGGLWASSRPATPRLARAVKSGAGTLASLYCRGAGVIWQA